MQAPAYTVYPYRWIVLLAFSIINAVIQLCWITFAPITVDCISLYNTTPFWIVYLSMSFMLVYIIVCVPASYIINHYGIRVGVGIGAVLTGLFGYLRGAYAGDFTMVIISQTGLAVAQPFILNALTKVAAEWFPIQERATATGIPALFQFIGIIVAMAITKPLALSHMAPGSEHVDINAVAYVLNIYGIISVVSAVLFILFAKDKPPTPPHADGVIEKFGMFDGLKHIFGHRDMLIILLVSFFGLGMFNAITTFIDIILASKGFTAGGNEAGNIGAIMMVAGVVGAIVMPTISDRLRKRKALMLTCALGMLPGMIGLAYCNNYVPLLIASGVFGFFFVGIVPVASQYAAEISHPAPESAAQGMIVLAGQISGTIFITMMALFGNISMEAFADATKASGSQSMKPFLVLFAVLALVNILLATLVKESTMIHGADQK
jgi:MFS family permease